jgi:hypothetical protein
MIAQSRLSVWRRMREPVPPKSVSAFAALLALPPILPPSREIGEHE